MRGARPLPRETMTDDFSQRARIKSFAWMIIFALEPSFPHDAPARHDYRSTLRLLRDLVDREAGAAAPTDP